MARAMRGETPWLDDLPSVPATTPASQPTQVITPPQQPPSSPLTAIGPSGVDGVPGPYDDGGQWLRNGLSRHSDGVWIALIAGWTGIWLAVWGAAIGLVIGGLAAWGFATGLGARIGVGQATGALGIIFGGFLGMVGGFLAVIRFLFVEHPFQSAASVASGAVLAILLIIIVAAFERPVLRLRGYRRLSRAEVRRVAPLVKHAADAMNLPALPRFAMSDVLVPNAWTHMRTVVLTSGLLQTLTDEELRAVLAHELQHWQTGDAVGLRFVWAAAWPVAVNYNVGMWLAGNRSSGGGQTKNVVRGFLVLLGWIIAFPTWVLIKLVITPVVAASQRASEYAADAAANRIGLGADLSSALRKMAAFEGGRTGWEQAMAATHPPTELRLEALELPQPDDYEYQEPDLRGPTWKEFARLLTFRRGS